MEGSDRGAALDQPRGMLGADSDAASRGNSQPSITPSKGKAKKKHSTIEDPLQLRFITSIGDPQKNNASIRKLVRSHVVRKYYASRRLARGEQEGSESAALEPMGVSSRVIRGIPARAAVCCQISTPPMTLLGASMRDPFASFPIRMTPRINILVNHCIGGGMARQVLSLIGRNATVLNTVGPGMNAFLYPVNKEANPIKTIYVPFSIADPCVFQGLLLLSARSYAQSSGDDSFHATALACKAECFRLVNIAMQDLQRATSDATIATVLMLAVEALMMGDLDASISHLQGLKTMIALRGGLHTLGLNGILEQLALSCDRASMMFTGSKSFFEPLDAFPRIQPAMSIPSGYQDLLISSSTSPQLRTILLNASSATLIKTSWGFGGTTISELSFVDEQCKFIEQHLAAAGHQLAHFGTEPDAAAVEKCVCLGVWAYHVRMLRSIPPPTSICLHVGYRMHAAVMPYRDLVGWYDHNLLLWVLFVGAHAILEGPVRYWFLQFLRDLSRTMGKVSWKEVREILKGFLWNDRCETYGRLLWSEVEKIGPHQLQAGVRGAAEDDCTALWTAHAEAQTL